MEHMRWCLDGYKAFKRSGLEMETMPRSIVDFRKVLVFKNTPVYAYLGDIMEDTSDLVKDVVDMAAAWDMYKKDRRSNKYLTLEQFESSFRVFANTHVPNSFQYSRTTSGRNGSAMARGYRLKNVQPQWGGGGGFGDASMAFGGDGNQRGVAFY